MLAFSSVTYVYGSLAGFTGIYFQRLGKEIYRCTSTTAVAVAVAVAAVEAQR